MPTADFKLVIVLQSGSLPGLGDVYKNARFLKVTLV